MTPQQAIVLLEALFAWEDMGEQSSKQRNAHFVIALRTVAPELAWSFQEYGTYCPIIESVSARKKQVEERKKFYTFLQDWSDALRRSMPHDSGLPDDRPLGDR